MQFLGDKPIVAIDGNTITVKGGEHVYVHSTMQKLLISEKKMEPAEYRKRRIDLFQAHVIEIMDGLGLTLGEYQEALKALEHTMARKQLIAANTALGVAGRSGPTGDENQDFYLVTYRDIAKFLPDGK